MQVLLSPAADEPIAWTELIGPTFGQWLANWHGQDLVSADRLWRLLPPIMIIAAAVRATLLAFQWTVWEWLSEGFARQLRNQLVQAYLQLSPQARREDASHDDRLAALIGNDTRMIKDYLVHFYGGLPREFFQVLFYLISLAILSPILFLIFTFGLLPAGAVLSRLGKKLRKRSNQALEDVSRVSEWIQQRLQGIETIKHYRSEALEAENMTKHTGRMMQSFLKAARVKAKTSPLTELVAIIAMVLVLIVSFHLVKSGQTSGSVLISFFAVLGALSQSASKLGKYFNSNREGAAALARMTGSLNYFSTHGRQLFEGMSTNISEDSQEQLRCQGLKVRYPGASHSALEDFSYRFEAGKIYCICGPSGAGKSTLMNVLLGLVEPVAGEVDWSIRFKGKWKLIGYVPQRVELANMSLAENICYPDQGWDEARLSAAIAAAGLEEVVASLPLAEGTPMGEGLVQISGGQAQRIMIARLFYHNMKFVMFDEGTSALDPETESLVYQSLLRLAASGCAILMIAHRSSAFTVADELLLIAEAKLRLAGAPQLVQTHKEFARWMGHGAEVE